MAPRPRTDSPVSLSIVASFLQFLSTVEAAPGADTEGLEVASQCLSEVFGLNRLRSDTRIQLLPMLELFTAGLAAATAQASPASSSSGADRPAAVASAGSSGSKDGKAKSGPSTSEASTSSGDSLLEQFREGLDLAGYFDGTKQGTPEYAAKLEQAKQTLEGASKDVRSSTKDAYLSAGYSDDTLALAEAFKIQGNMTMTAKRYHDAIQLYTLAISLCTQNPIFYSNRAAALTQVGKFDEAIADCEVAISLDPRYSKAYSRMGLVYFAQGRLQEAIEKGFKRALEIDPSSVSVRENLKTAQQKLEEQARARQYEARQHEARPHPGDAQTSGTFHMSSGPMPLPPEIASLLPSIMNLAAQFGAPMQEQQQQAGSTQSPGDGRNPSATQNPGDGGNPFATQSPGDGGNPFATQSPADGSNPSATQSPGDGRNPSATQSPGDGCDPSAAQSPGDGPNPSAATGTNFTNGGGVQRNPDMGSDGSFSVTFNGQQLPPQYAGLMHSVFQQMFGAAPGQNNFPAGSNQNANTQPGPPGTHEGN